jgi:hypothetical protein
MYDCAFEKSKACWIVGDIDSSVDLDGRSLFDDGSLKVAGCKAELYTSHLTSHLHPPQCLEKIT